MEIFNISPHPLIDQPSQLWEIKIMLPKFDITHISIVIKCSLYAVEPTRIYRREAILPKCLYGGTR